MKKLPKKPTASELEILHVLWSKGPSTVREVLEKLNENKNMGYTGALKLLQIMTSKGLVRRDETQRAHIYAVCRPAEQTKRQLARDMRQRVFGGSTSQLMMHALAGYQASSEEIGKLRQMLNAYKADNISNPKDLNLSRPLTYSGPKHTSRRPGGDVDPHHHQAEYCGIASTGLNQTQKAGKHDQ